MARFIRAAAVASAAAPGVIPDVVLPPLGADWMARAESIARAVAASLRARAGLDGAAWSAMPCFVGSSSHFIGALESQRAPVFEPPVAFARRLAGWFGVSGPLASVDTACTSGITALGLAMDAPDHALVLGVELANRLSHAGFAALNLLSPGRARPCDRDRDGLALGEALAAMVVSRTGPWRVAASASAIDPAGLAAPAPNEMVMARAMEAALSAAGWAPDDVQLLKLQASGSPGGDLAEACAMREVFRRPPRYLVSFKGAIGHTLGASGPAELALLLAALAEGRVPSTEGFHKADPALGIVPKGGDGSGVRRILFNLAGFGGSVASVALERA